MHARTLTRSCKRAAATALALALAHCAPRAPRASWSQHLGQRAGSSVRAPREDRASVWEPVAGHVLPLPIMDVSALPGGDVLVIAGQRLLRFDGARATPVCEPLGGEVPSTLRSDGARFLATGGDGARPRFWFSDDAGRTCRTVSVPGDPRDRAERVSTSLDGALAYAWAPHGLVLRSTDGGARWARLPPLPGVVYVCPGASGQTLAAARVGRDPLDGASALFRIADSAASRWTPLEGTLRARGALEMRRQTDGSVLVFDGAGRSRVRRDGRVERVRDDAALRSNEDAPRVIVPAGRSRFVFSTAAGVLWRDDDEGTAPIVAMPFAPEHYALDASAEGLLWYTTGSQLLRGSVAGGPLTAVTEWPIESESAAVMSVQGSQLAVASRRGVAAPAVFRSADGGARWATLDVPTEAGAAKALAVGSRGETLYLGEHGLYATDGGAFTRSTLPAALGPPASLREVFVSGARWIVAGEGLATSDDQGAHWRVRLASPSAPRDPAEPGSVVISGSLTSLTRAGTSLFALDEAQALYRSDDAGSTFTQLATAASMGLAGSEFVPRTPAYSMVNGTSGFVGARVVSDGARRIAVLNRTHVARSLDGGITWSAQQVRNAVSLARVLFRDDGLVALTSPQTACPSGPSSRPTGSPGSRMIALQPRSSQLVLARESMNVNGQFLQFVAAHDGCEHQAQLATVDGAWLYILRPGGAIERARIDRL